MVVSCCVVNCTNRAIKGTSIRFYRIPKVILNQGERERMLSEKRREVMLGCRKLIEKIEIPQKVVEFAQITLSQVRYRYINFVNTINNV